MDQFNTSGLGLQKCLLALRKERDLLKAQGKDEEAQRLTRKIAGMEATLAGLPLEMRPVTLQ